MYFTSRLTATHVYAFELINPALMLLYHIKKTLTKGEDMIWRGELENKGEIEGCGRNNEWYGKNGVEARTRAWDRTAAIALR